MGAGGVRVAAAWRLGMMGAQLHGDGGDGCGG